MITVVQNFICTQPQRLEVVKRNTIKLGDTFPDIDFFVNYNSDNENWKPIKEHYLTNVPKINLFNNTLKSKNHIQDDQKLELKD